MRRKTPILYANESVYLDPTACDSIISYKIVRGRRLYGDISLTDCNRKIVWGFDDEPSSIKKIGEAITILTKFREQWIAARAAQRRPRKK